MRGISCVGFRKFVVREGKKAVLDIDPETRIEATLIRIGCRVV